MHAQLAVSLDQAKTIALIAVAVLAAAALAWAWLMKTIVQKVAGFAILALLAVLVWFQRDSLQDCADKVRASADVSGRSVDATCAFFGQDVPISTGR